MVKCGHDKIAVLFVRWDSGYKSMFRSGLDCYDKTRGAKNFKGDIPVIAHPPCRAWGVLSHMANPDEGEKDLALFSIDLVRNNGGIVEHPKGSRLWKEKRLPDEDFKYDDYGGFTVTVDQFDFGHVAHKDTKFYICGHDKDTLPCFPKKRNEKTNRSICGNVEGTKRCTQYQREYTPEKLIDWLISISINCVGAEYK